MRFGQGHTMIMFWKSAGSSCTCLPNPRLSQAQSPKEQVLWGFEFRRLKVGVAVKFREETRERGEGRSGECCKWRKAVMEEKPINMLGKTNKRTNRKTRQSREVWQLSAQTGIPNIPRKLKLDGAFTATLQVVGGYQKVKRCDCS